MLEKIRENKTINFVISALILFFGIYFSFPERGLMSTIPFLVVNPIIAKIFSIHSKSIYALSFVFSLFLTLIIKSEILYSIVYCLFVLLLTFIGISAFNLYKKQKLLSAVLIFISLAIFVFINGSIGENISSDIRTKNYIKKLNYENVQTKYTYYSFTEKRYMTKVSFYDNDAKLNAIISDDGKGDIVDGYQEYIEEKLLDKARYEMSNILSINVKTDFATRSQSIDTDKKLFLNDDYKALYSKMNFEIAFYEYVDNKEDFKNIICECLYALKTKNFEFGKITFYGGNTDNFLFQAVISENTLDTQVLDLITDFEKSSFKDLNKDKYKENRWFF